MRELKPVWKTSSFLVYVGGLTVLLGGLAALGYLSTQFSGGGARTAWALLILVVLWFLAELLRAAGTWVAAGIFAFTTVIAWGYFVGSAWAWFGWLNRSGGSAFGVWSVAHLSLELLILLAAVVAHARWRFPFIALISAVVFWVFVTDFISNGGWWTYTVSLLIGLLYLLAGTVAGRDGAQLRRCRRRALRDPDGRFAHGGVDGEVPGLGARGPTRRERRAGDVKPGRGVRGVGAVAARASLLVGSAALG